MGYARRETIPDNVTPLFLFMEVMSMAIGTVSDALLEEMEQWVNEGVIDCPKCGNRIETDSHCCCGWKNPLLLLGMI